MKLRISFNIETKKISNPTVVSKLFGSRNCEIQHFIDWDISLGILNSVGNLVSPDSFIFYNNCNYENGTITLRSDTLINVQSPEFDEEVIIDFSELSIEANSIVFYISNHQKFNFEITHIDVQIDSVPKTCEKENQFRITNTSICNAIELFKFIRNNQSWTIETLNNPIIEPNGLEYIFNKITSDKNISK